MTAPATPIDASRGSTLFDPGRTRGRGVADLLRSFRTAAALGWKMEANWTDPVLFFIYSVAKPVSAALILIVMLEVIAGATGPDYRGYVVVGSALWSFVISGIAGLAWSVLDDRERYRMLKYVYVSPSDFVTVLLGRGTARIAVGAMGAAITLVVGVVLLGVSFDPSAGRLAPARRGHGARPRGDRGGRGDPGRDLPPDPPGGVVVSRGGGGGAVPGVGRGLPAGRPAGSRSRRSAWPTP